MRSTTLITLALAAGATVSLAQEGTGSAAGSTESQSASRDERAACERVLRRMPQIVASEQFESATLEDRRDLLLIWADCAIEFRNPQATYEALKRYAPIAANPVTPYRLLLRIVLEEHTVDEALEIFDTWTARNLDINALPLQDILRLLAKVEDLPNGSEQALRIHETLVQLEYIPGPLENAASLRIGHTRLLLQLGRDEEAARRLDRIDDLSFSTLIALAANKSFDAALAQWQPIDWRSAAERSVARIRDLAAAHPRRLEARVAYLGALRQAGRDADALRDADSVLAEVEAAPDAFDDTGRFLIWIHNERAYALHALGRTGEAYAAMRVAIDAGEGGRRNVSQSINLAGLYARDRQWKEALSTLASMGQTSVYGEVLAAGIRACAAAESGNKAMLAAELAYLRANADASSTALMRGLICANELDEAAALYIRRLEDPGSRSDVLVALQPWARDRPTSRAQRDFRRRLDAVQSRPDVQAAFDAVGRIVELPFAIPHFGGY